MPHLCFYSEKCRFSQSFISELKRTPYFGEFKMVCVDPDASGRRNPIVEKGRAEKWLNAVPTIIIDGESGPRTDAEVFNWLSVRKLQDASSGRSGVPSAGGVEQPGVGGEPLAYGNEMAGNRWSDSYSFFDQQFEVSKGSGFDPIPRAFAQLQDSTGGIVPGGGSQTQGQVVAQAQKRSKKEQEMDSRLESFQRSRDSDFPSLQRK